MPDRQVAHAISTKGKAEEKNDEEKESKPVLQNLLAALALGAKSVNALPYTSSKRAKKRLAVMSHVGNKDSSDLLSDDDDDNDNDNSISDSDASNDDDDDELAYFTAFKEFRTASTEVKEEIASTLKDILEAVELGTMIEDDQHDYTDDKTLTSADKDGKKRSMETNSFAFGAFINPLSLSNVKKQRKEQEQLQLFEDPLLWNACSEASEALLERVEVFLNESSKDQSANKSSLAKSQQQGNDGNNTKVQVMISNIVDVKKPQVAYDFSKDIDNARETPYIPLVASSLAQSHRKLFPIPGHGLESSYLPEDLIAPIEYYDNPLRHEIENFEYQPWQLESPTEEQIGEHGLGCTLFSENISSFIDKRTNNLNMKGCAWIDRESDLIALSSRLTQKSVREIAVDLEAHSWRSFGGFTCLMQISVRQSSGDECDDKKSKVNFNYTIVPFIRIVFTIIFSFRIFVIF